MLSHCKSLKQKEIILMKEMFSLKSPCGEIDKIISANVEDPPDEGMKLLEIIKNVILSIPIRQLLAWRIWGRA